VPSTKGCVSDAPEGRQSSVWFWPIPGAAALVELFVAGAAEALFVVAVALVPGAVEDEPDPVADDPVLELAARLVEDAAWALLLVVELDVVVLLAVAPLVELVAMLSIVAPRPAVPADAVPALDDPLPEELGGVDTVTVGALVRVAPEVTVIDGLLPVLLRVCPDVTWED
jgi:hypothetical protein